MAVHDIQAGGVSGEQKGICYAMKFQEFFTLVSNYVNSGECPF